MTSPFLQRAVGNSIYAGLGTLATFVLGFLFAGLTIRFLGESRAGYLLTLQAVAGLSILLGGVGLQTPAIRRIAILYTQGDLSTASTVVGSVSMVSVATGLILSLLIIVFNHDIFVWSRLDPIYQADAFWATLFVAGNFLLTQTAAPLWAVYEALQRYELLAVLTTAFGLLSGLSGIVALSISPSMATVASVGFAVSFIRLSIDTYLVWRLLGRVPLPTWRWGEVRPMIGFGGWTYFGRLGGILFTNVDRLILAAFLGSAALPYYVLPQRLYSQMHAALTGQSRFLFPMLSTLGDAAVAQIERLEDRLRWFVALVSGVAYTLLALIGPDLLNRVVGPEFGRQAALPLVLVCIQGFFHAQMIVPYYSSWAIGSGAPNSVSELFNGMLVILTAIWLIPRFGFVGASVAQLWIIVTAISHTLWTRHVVTPQATSWGWLQAYVSPSVMIAAWVSIVEVGTRFVLTDSLMFYAIVLLGGIIGFIAMGFVEQVVFHSQERWLTLMRATRILLQRMQARGQGPRLL